MHSVRSTWMLLNLPLNTRFLVLLFVVSSGTANAVNTKASVNVTKACQFISLNEFKYQEKSISSKKLIATASWCSSCKLSLEAAVKNPDKFRLLVAFDEPENVTKVLEKMQIASECFYNDEIVKYLKIEGLPWVQ